MDEQLAKILRELRKIESDPGYKARSRSLILSERRKREKAGFFELLTHFQTNKFTIASEIMAVVLVAVFLGGYYLYESTKSKNEVAQADEINSSIQLKLNQIQYIIRTQAPTGSLNSDIISSLNQAVSDLNQAKADLNNDKLDSAIQNIKSAETIFRSIEGKLGIPTETPNSTPNTSTSTQEMSSSSLNEVTSTPSSSISDTQ